MEALAVDKLVEKAHFHSDIALAIAEAMDITIKEFNFVTVHMMETRFANLETRLELRFSSLEQSIAAVKVGGLKLYAGLVIVLFSTLAANHYYLVNRAD